MIDGSPISKSDMDWQMMRFRGEAASADMHQVQRAREALPQIISLLVEVLKKTLSMLMRLAWNNPTP